MVTCSHDECIEHLSLSKTIMFATCWVRTLGVALSTSAIYKPDTADDIFGMRCVGHVIILYIYK